LGGSLFWAAAHVTKATHMSTKAGVFMEVVVRLPEEKRNPKARRLSTLDPTWRGFTRTLISEINLNRRIYRPRLAPTERPQNS
jgi:hypothetical protein